MFEKNALVLLNKPTGMSSFLAVKRVKGILKANKTGHMGTLDPLGTGLLIVGVNKATKEFDNYLNKKKTYVAVFHFGYTTDTLDSEGIITNKKECVITLNDVLNVIPKFIGKQAQMPPDYSAKKINGKKACDLAREGKAVELKPKDIEIYNLRVLRDFGNNNFQFEIECSSGTYIRSLARDIAKELNTYGVMLSIIRTKCGEFDISQSCTLEDLEKGNFYYKEINYGK